MIVSKNEIEAIQDESEMIVPSKVHKNPILFEKWFVTTYMKKFHQLPEYTKASEQRLEKDRMEKIDQYFETVSKVVSFNLLGRDESHRMMEETRLRDVVNMRKLVCYIMVKKLKYRLSRIGRMIGKDHATVLYYGKCVEDYIKFDKKFQKKFLDIQGDLFRMGIVW